MVEAFLLVFQPLTFCNSLLKNDLGALLFEGKGVLRWLIVIRVVGHYLECAGVDAAFLGTLTHIEGKTKVLHRVCSVSLSSYLAKGIFGANRLRFGLKNTVVSTRVLD